MSPKDEDLQRKHKLYHMRQWEVEKKAPIRHRYFSRIPSSKLCNTFSLQLAQQLLQQGLATNKEGAKNMACSPLSIDTVLGIIALGAEGKTLKQILKFVGFETVEDLNAVASKVVNHVLGKSEGDNAPDISFVNGLWVDQQFNLHAKFEEVVRDLYAAEVKAVDFENKVDEAVKEANSWVSKQSRGLVKEIFTTEQIKGDTHMLLANSLYFKGVWHEKFKVENTKNKEFHLLNGHKVEVPFMNLSYKTFEYGTYEGSQVLRMLYEEGEPFQGDESRSFSMYIFLPEEKDGLPILMQNMVLDASLFNDKLKLHHQSIVEVSIPKFKFECHLSLEEHLQELGLTLPFDPENKELSGIIDYKTNEWPYVDKIFQKCYVETNEEGTVAYVVTAMSLRGGGGPVEPPLRFVADHPFMFIIREDFSGAMLYVGTVVNPALSS